MSMAPDIIGLGPLTVPCTWALERLATPVIYIYICIEKTRNISILIYQYTFCLLAQ